MSTIDLYPAADIEAKSIVDFTTVDKNAQIVQGIIKTNESQKQHYVKIRNRWSSAEKIVVTTLTVFTILSGIVCIILPVVGIQVDVTNNQTTVEVQQVPENITLEVLGSIGTICGILAAILQNCFKRRKRVFSLKIALYNKKIDQAYILWQKAINDGVITEDELDQFKTINNQTSLTPEEQQQELAMIKAEDVKNNPVVQALEDLKGLVLDNIDKVKDVSNKITRLSNSTV